MNSGGQRDAIRRQADDLETARYIADMTREMSAMARRADLDVIAYLLELARLEAEETVQKKELKSG